MFFLMTYSWSPFISSVPMNSETFNLIQDINDIQHEEQLVAHQKRQQKGKSNQEELQFNKNPWKNQQPWGRTG